MSIFDTLFGQSEERDAIFFRYDPGERIAEYANLLNTGMHTCCIIRKNDNEILFLIYINTIILHVRSTYNSVEDSFKVIQTTEVSTTQVENDYKLELVTSIEENFEFAIKQEGKSYQNRQAKNYSYNLLEKISRLDNYDQKLIEFQRAEEMRLIAEEEERSAQQQLATWKAYVGQELSLLEDADLPFEIEQDKVYIDHKTNSVEVKVSTRYTKYPDEDDIKEICRNIGCPYVDPEDTDVLVVPLNFIDKLTDKNILNGFVPSRPFQLTMEVSCQGFWNAKDFGKAYGYKRPAYEYSRHDSANGTISIMYKSINIDEIKNFYSNACNTYEFDRIPPIEQINISVGICKEIVESDEDRQKRLFVLKDKDIVDSTSRDATRLGKLNLGRSGRNTIMIKLPYDKEEKKKAKEFFKQENLKGLKLYFSLAGDISLLRRQESALDDLQKGENAQNPRLKQFIFNSNRAKTTQVFEGLTYEQFARTSEYEDCSSTKLMRLNESQQEAVVKGVYAEDLCVLQGPPGTGKTTVISELIWQHIRKKQSIRIMLTSQTNLAIDNALDRLRGEFTSKQDSVSWRNKMLIKPLRIADEINLVDEGRPFTKRRIENWAKGIVEEDVDDNIVAQWMQHISSRVPTNSPYISILNEWKDALENPTLEMRVIFTRQYLSDYNILCMTSGKVGTGDFHKNNGYKGFDVVIVDEASKATLPELIMPLMHAQKSIIIGDHRQLPPVLFEGDFFKKVKEAAPELEAQLDSKFKHELVEESLFKRLITHRFISSTIKATFNEQYRMHPHISDVISQFYTDDPGGLKCGISLADADSTNWNNPQSRYHGFSLGNFINPNIHTIWVDVPDGREMGDGDSSYNLQEIEAIQLILQALNNSRGFDDYMSYWKNSNSFETRNTESKIGIISYYASQVNRIHNAISEFCKEKKIGYSTNSVDKFQGQERGIVIVSNVRTSTMGFIKSPERINVALSRARRLLIIVGNSKFWMSDKAVFTDGHHYYRRIIKQIRENGKFIDYRDLKSLLLYGN